MFTAMRSRPEIYEEHAARCVEIAAETHLIELQALYLELAGQWHELAGMVRSLQTPRSCAARLGKRFKLSCRLLGLSRLKRNSSAPVAFELLARLILAKRANFTPRRAPLTRGFFLPGLIGHAL